MRARRSLAAQPGNPYPFPMNWRTLLGTTLLAGAASAAQQTVTIKVDGWHSKGDVFKAQSVVKEVKGVASATGDLPNKQLVVVFDDAVATKAQVEKAVADAGYTVAR